MENKYSKYTCHNYNYDNYTYTHRLNAIIKNAKSVKTVNGFLFRLFELVLFSFTDLLYVSHKIDKQFRITYLVISSFLERVIFVWGFYNFRVPFHETEQNITFFNVILLFLVAKSCKEKS